MHSLLHDIPQFLILFLDELFLIFNQMLSIREFGRRGLHCLNFLNTQTTVACWVILHTFLSYEHFLKNKKQNFDLKISVKLIFL